MCALLVAHCMLARSARPEYHSARQCILILIAQARDGNDVFCAPQTEANVGFFMSVVFRLFRVLFLHYEMRHISPEWFHLVDSFASNRLWNRLSFLCCCFRGHACILPSRPSISIRKHSSTCCSVYGIDLSRTCGPQPLHAVTSSRLAYAAGRM